MKAAITIVWRILDARMRRKLALLPILLLIGGLLDGIGVSLFLPLLQGVATPEKLESLPWVAEVYAASGVTTAPGFLMLLSGVLLAVFVVKNLFALYLTRYQQGFIWENRSSAATLLLRYYLSAPYTFHLQNNSAVLLRNITQTVQEVFVGVVLPLVTLAAEGIVVLVICLLLIVVDPMVTILVLIILGSTVSLYYLLIHKLLRQWGETTQRTSRSIIQHVQQALGSIREIKVMGREAYFTDLFAVEIALNSASRLRYQIASQVPRYLIEIIAVVILGAILAVTTLSGRPPADAIPVLGLFAVAAFRLMPSLNRISGQLQNLRFGSAALEELDKDLSGARHSTVSNRAAEVVPLPFERSLVLDRVSFRYPGSAVHILSDISLSVRHGESVAFVGMSGAGKSTLAAVIMGLLMPTSGRLLADDQPLTEQTMASWRRHIGFIPQEVALLDDSLKANIAFGIPAPLIDRRKLTDAARDAALGDVVAGLPDGYETRLGERGVRLSGGQRQRVGIARALYLNADILVLDEATSALDAETESEISRAIGNLQGTKTIITIAHRLSTVRNCDRIYVMEAGRVVDSGSFDELTVRNDAFRSMVDKMALRAAQ